MTLRLLALIFFFAFSNPLCAMDMGGSNMLIPIAGRAAGAYGSEWRTDLVITNLEPRPAPVILTFYANAADRSFVSTTLPGSGTLVLEDVLRSAFLRDSGMGMLRVSSAQQSARFVARAYIYNRGNGQGEYGQGVTAVPLDALTGDHVLSGVTAMNGRRTNIGVANPWLVPATLTLTLLGRDGEVLATLYRTVPSSEVLQLNDAFAAFGVAPVVEASVRVQANVAVYAYAAIVRADSGDAVFVPGSGVSVQTSSTVAPQCAEPASLNLAGPGAQPGQSWIVLLQPDTPADYIANVLPARYGYEPKSVYEAISSFVAELTPHQIAALRCDSTVLMVEQNAEVPAP
ncbi:MAG TPA: hypothetical protein VF883_19230 [Thermoanaerobaculia bacterium]|jgi:hypothetical protein